MTSWPKVVNAALAVGVAFGVGYAVAPGGTTVVKHPVVHQTVTGIPPAAIRVPLESSVTPDGAKPEAPPASQRFRQFGSSIHIDRKGLLLIENFEEVQKSTYCQYWDAYGSVWTRGFGETDFGGRFPTNCISHATAEANLARQIEGSYQWAVRGLGVSFNQNQVDALDSFVWNLGAGIFTGSLRYAIQHHNPYPLLAYDHAGGQVLSGLASRRRAEVRLFLTPAREETAQQAAARHAREAAARRTRLHRELTDTRGRLRALHRALSAHHCRTVHGRRAYHSCRRWAREGRAAHHREHRLIREGAR